MITREEIIKEPGYWLEQIQGEVYRLLKGYMDEHQLTQKEVAAQFGFSPSYLSQILNGNFNFTISKLIELALAIGHVPQVSFKKVEEFLEEENKPEQTTYHFTYEINPEGGRLAPISPQIPFHPEETTVQIVVN